ncbi:MAG TPA: DNA polymerase IV [Burkholderiales bacterium]|nr:DNA polymerase IV [Burkholderiales bacterium]
MITANSSTSAEKLAPRRWIAHLDMDAFYASVELLRYPELRGKAVVVGGRRTHQPVLQPDGTRGFARLRDYAGRGVITTATYEARALGVRSGMGLMKAAALAPDAVLLPADFDQYRKYSRQFKAAVAGIAPLIEDRGIDEIYIDLSDVPGVRDATDADAHAGVRAVAQRIKSCVRDATGLSCSIGLSPNKLLSKLCSELDKPDGLTVVTLEDIPSRIWPLPVGRINGIGPKANAKLELLGIGTIGELAAADRQWLIEQFGANFGAWLHEAAHGRDQRPVVTFSEPKSISRETTFERDLHARRDREELGTIFTRLCEQLAADLLRKGYAAKTIGVKLRYDDFRIVTRETTLPAHIREPQAIRQAAGRCLKKELLGRRLRLLGVRAGGERNTVADRCSGFPGGSRPAFTAAVLRVQKKPAA